MERSTMEGLPAGTSWSDVIRPPIPGRAAKPRPAGITMVMDKGRGVLETGDFLELCGEYVDYVKLAFGTSALYPSGVLREKIALIKKNRCEVYPGGTFLEIAFIQNRIERYFERAAGLGFTAVEVSDGTVQIDPPQREKLIRRASEFGFIVLTEVGKKDPRQKTSGSDMACMVRDDLDAGARWVIIEGRESGRGVGVYDREGHIERERFEDLLAGDGVEEYLIWEAPLKEQQEVLIRHFGPNVNMGNIPPQDVIALESMRQGLRNDTLKACLAPSNEYAALV